MAQGQKQYGLLVPKKVNQGPLQPRLAVFGDNSDSDNEDGADWVKKALKRDSQKAVQKKQTQLQMQRAIDQDPTVYQYDEVYDKMEQEKSETKAVKKNMEKKPRYIQSLLKQAERRKREQERRLEREVQKERVAEGQEFKDKEEFVTSAYRKKLEEFKKMDEEERLQDRIEAITDVSKQKDLTGFYRHMYRQAVGEESKKSDVIIKQEKIDVEEKTVNKPPDTASLSKTDTKEQTEKKTTRQYRKRKSSSSESEQEVETKQTRHRKNNEKNNDEDSDFTGQSSSSDSSHSDTSDTEESKQKKSKEEKKNTKNKEVNPETFTSGSEEGEIREAAENKSSREAGENKSSKRKGDTNKDEALSNKKSRNDKSEVKEKTDKSCDKKGDEENNNNNKLETPKPSIWEKRTVGAVFEAALERYFARKAIKTAS